MIFTCIYISLLFDNANYLTRWVFSMVACEFSCFSGNLFATAVGNVVIIFMKQTSQGKTRARVVLVVLAILGHFFNRNRYC